jgi:hypothetical protein
VQFTVELTAAAEVIPGDPDGSGTATLTVNPGLGEVCWTLEVTGIDVTEAHIHKAAAGANGPIVVPFTLPEEWDGSAAGCTEDLDRLLLADIVANPSSYYINVHNGEFARPLGALRGQLDR